MKRLKNKEPFDVGERLSTFISDFARNKHGNFAIITSLVLSVVLVGVSLAIDGSKAYSAKSKLQDTTDAIALIAVKDKNLTPRQLYIVAEDYFAQIYDTDMAGRINVENINRQGDKVTVTAKHNIDTFLGGLVGHKTLDVSTESVAIYSEKAVDIAMVLDTTFSMNGSKLDNLKNAATSLVETVEDQVSDNVRMSVVPFAQYVNVGVSRRHAPWLDVPSDSTHTGDEVCYMKKDVTSTSNCRTESRSCQKDGVTYSCPKRVCDYTYGDPYEACEKPVTTHKWTGCVGSRKSPQNLAVAYDKNKIPGLQNVQCGRELRTLTDNFSDVKNTIDNMVAQGTTYMPSGLMWGWRTLDESEPFKKSAKSLPRVKKTEKVLILMTDGENTQSKEGLLHTGGNINEANDTTETLCAAIKRSEIIVYTIAYEVNDTDTKNLLEECATDRSKYFDARDARSLNQAFEAIGENLKDLRISA